MALGGTYNTGTVDVTAGSTSVAGTGVLWVDVVEGDWVVVGTAVAVIDAVNASYNVITLKDAWAGSTAAGATYRILKMSWLRYDPSLTQERLRTFIVDLEAAGLFLFVEGAVPDPALGEDGQYALKTNTAGPWSLWYKVDGVWEAQGSPVGVNWQGTWGISEPYDINDAVFRLGSAYISLTAGNLNNPPESSPDDWDLYVAGGYRYDFLIWDNGRPTSGETLIRAPMATAVTFPVDFAGSVATAEAVSSGTAVYSIQKNGVEFGTLTFTASAPDGTYASVSGATFAVGDVLTVVAPNPRDETLSGVAATIVGYR